MSKQTDNGKLPSDIQLQIIRDISSGDVATLEDFVRLYIADEIDEYAGVGPGSSQPTAAIEFVVRARHKHSYQLSIPPKVAVEYLEDFGGALETLRVRQLIAVAEPPDGGIPHVQVLAHNNGAAWGEAAKHLNYLASMVFQPQPELKDFADTQTFLFERARINEKAEKRSGGIPVKWILTAFILVASGVFRECMQ